MGDHIMRKKKDIKIKIKEEREMTEAEVENLVSMIFEWWKRELEEREKSEDGMVTKKPASDEG
jgi:hypothetical protein